MQYENCTFRELVDEIERLRRITDKEQVFFDNDVIYLVRSGVLYEARDGGELTCTGANEVGFPIATPAKVMSALSANVC